MHSFALKFVEFGVLSFEYNKFIEIEQSTWFTIFASSTGTTQSKKMNEKCQRERERKNHYNNLLNY